MSIETLAARHRRRAQAGPGRPVLRIVNTHGTQVVDLWALVDGDVLESMSMPHCRNPWYRLAPRPGDVFVTNLRRPILRLMEDSSPGSTTR